VQAVRALDLASTAKARTGLPTQRPMSVTGLGWRTESGVLPSKPTLIEGVQQGSLVDLKVALYEEEESAKRRKLGEADPRKDKLTKRRGRLDPKFCGAGGSNRGVEARSSADVAEEEESRRERDQALQRKVALYDQLASGEGGSAGAAGGGGGDGDGGGVRVDGGNFLIDFFAKGAPRGGGGVARARASNAHTPWAGGGGSRAVGQLEMVTADMRAEAERQDWEASGLNEGVNEVQRRANVDMLKSLSGALCSLHTCTGCPRRGMRCWPFLCSVGRWL
jgi:hypothetical protein